MNFKTDYSAENLVLVVNPRVPFTKIGVYNNSKLVFLKKISHPDADLGQFTKYEDQTNYRKEAIIKELRENDVDVNKIRIVISRGGLIKPVKSGIYAVDKKVKDDLYNSVQGSDIVNLGGLISDAIASELPDSKAVIADPVVVDEYDDVARITGLPEIERRSIFHALNQKQAACRYSKSIHKACEDLNLIIVHLGTGITVGAHNKGRVIDANMGYDGDGPFSPIRAGSLPTGDLIKLCYSGKYTEEEMLKRVSLEGGLFAHFGTPSGIDVDKMVKQGNKQASWRTDPKQAGAGGCMGDIGTHAENLAEFITGLEISEICADLTSFIPGRKLDDDGNCLLRFKGGAKGLLHASQISIGEENNLGIYVYGEKAALEWHQEKPNDLQFKPLDAPVQVWKRGNEYINKVSPAAARGVRIPPGHPEGFFEAFANNYKNFADTVRKKLEGKKPTKLELDFPDVADGVRGMAFVETVIKSAKTSKKWTKFRV